MAVGLVAFIWFLALSEWLLVRPGTIMVQRSNVLFHSDTSLSIKRMTARTFPQQPAFQYFVHPLELLVGWPVCRAVASLLGTFLPSHYAMILAPRLVVAAVAATGVGALAAVAGRQGIAGARYVLLLPVYLLFTANTVVALPEHFGISHGLLSIAFAVASLASHEGLTRIVLGWLAVLAAGTTLTNGLFPFACLVQKVVRSVRLGTTISLAAITGVAGITLLLARQSDSIGWFVHRFLNMRVFENPAEAVLQAVLSFVYPAIGPTPAVKPVLGSPLAVMYTPFDVTAYSWVQGLGALAWVCLCGACVVTALRSEVTRSWALGLLGWILYNAALHNIWGDEIFLYSPHWSWALMGLVLLGVRGLSVGCVTVLALPLIAAQVATLVSIRNAIISIVQ